MQLYSSKVTPLTNPTEVTDQGFCYCNSNAWGWHNSHQSRAICITDQIIFQNGKQVNRRNNNGSITLPCGTPDTTPTTIRQKGVPGAVQLPDLDVLRDVIIGGVYEDLTLTC